MTVLPEDAWSRVKPVRQIGQAVLPWSYERSRLLLPVFRDMSGHTGLALACGATGGSTRPTGSAATNLKPSERMAPTGSMIPSMVSPQRAARSRR